MFHFLGIIAEDDFQQGIMIPSYILCQSHGTSENRSGWRVIKQTPNNAMLGMNKVLVKTLTGNDDMIDFLSNYRTRDHMHGDSHYKHEQTKKYYPKGALCWFECNKYGEPGQLAIFITKVPVKQNQHKTDSGFQRMKQSKEKTPKIKTILSDNELMEMNEFSNVKPRLPQRR